MDAKMSNEMILAYMYYLTHMYSGDMDKWKRCYDAWKNFAIQIGHEEYEKTMGFVSKFNSKYMIKRKKAR